MPDQSVISLSSTAGTSGTAPRLVAEPADFESPEAVAAAHYAAWCHRPVDGPANQNIATAAQWVTEAGFESDKATAIADSEWAKIVEAGLTTVCGPVTAELSAGAPSSATAKWVVVGAQRNWLNRSGEIVESQWGGETRLILKAPDGRWLVDVAVLAG